MKMYTSNFSLHISIKWLYNVLYKLNICMFKLLFSFYLYLRHDPDLSFAITEYFHSYYMLQLTN